MEERSGMEKENREPISLIFFFFFGGGSGLFKYQLRLGHRHWQSALHWPSAIGIGQSKCINISINKKKKQF